MTLNSIVSNALNALLVDIQNDVLTSSCPVGTISDIDYNNCPLSYSGTYGNTTTSGVYATYSILIKELLNTINLQITSEIFYTSDVQTQIITDTFTFSYVDTLEIKGSASGYGEVYIPSYTYDGCCLWFTNIDWCKCCCVKIPWVGKTCTTYPCGWDTYCASKCEISVPSTYSDALLIGRTFDYTIGINNIVGSAGITLTLSTIDPNIPGNTLYTVNLNIPNIPQSIIYIYNIGVKDVTIDFGSISTNGIDWQLSNDEIRSILNFFGANLSQIILTMYANYTFQFLINYP